MNLSYFLAADQTLFQAGQAFFENELQLGLNASSGQPIADVRRFLHGYADTTKALDLVGKTFFLGKLTSDALAANSGRLQGEADLRPRLSLEEALPAAPPTGKYAGLMVFGLELRDRPSRAQVTELARAFNRASQHLPVVVLLRYPAQAAGAPAYLALASTERTPYVQTWRAGEKVTKVSVLFDIVLAKPHSGHLRILQDLRVDAGVQTLEELYRQWNRVLSIQTLNKQFYRDLSNWYFWAVKEVSFPAWPDGPATEERHATAMIRLITRLIFVWFLKEKSLLADDFFDYDALYGGNGKAGLLKPEADGHQAGPAGGQGADKSTYYKAILQNLFFATLNTEMGEHGQGRNWRPDRRGPQGQNPAYGEPSWLRFKSYFHEPDRALALFRAVPFLNGGLFECLDADAEAGRKKDRALVDCFSEGEQQRLHVPDRLFFGQPQQIDLSAVYGERRRNHEQVRGLIGLLDSYKFTVAENTPLEEEVALDPELLGRVFENLLASYNPETQTTARKMTGSFYTPREVVEFMVDESLITYLAPFAQPPASPAANGRRLAQAVDQPDVDLFGRARPQQAALALVPEKAGQPAPDAPGPEAAATLRALLRAPAGTANPFDDATTERLIRALNDLKLLDPACGSGAFPMGALQRLVHLLSIVDPNNKRWKEAQLRNAQLDKAAARQFRDEVLREKALSDAESREADIRRSFDTNLHEVDYARKLYLIENCLYGVDIQPVAAQITKLRCFITLLVDQKPQPAASNLGIRPLPNLETHFVAANTLLRLSQQQVLETDRLRELKEELAQLRHEYFTVKTRARKIRLKAEDREKRQAIALELEKAGSFDHATALRLASWDPYNVQRAADFFQADWMLGVSQGFDIVIGNPPYVRQERIKEHKAAFAALFQQTYAGTADLYVYFYERAWQLLKPGGVLCYISPNKFFRASYGQKLRTFLTLHARLHHLIDFGDAPVFDAIAYPAILLAQKAELFRERTQHRLQAHTWDPAAAVPVELFVSLYEQRRFALPQTALAPGGWSLEDEATRDLLQKLRAAGTPLGEYVGDRFYRGILTGCNSAFYLKNAAEREALLKADKRLSKLIKPFLTGREVKRYQQLVPAGFLLYVPWDFPIKDYPVLKEHLEKAGGNEIKNRPEVLEGRFPWYALSRYAAEYVKEFEKPKIVYQEIATYQSFSYDTTGFYANNKVFIIPTDNLALLALLNSKVVWWFLNQVATKMVGGALAMQTPAVRQVPIPKQTAHNKAALAALVDKISVAKLQDPAADLESIEATINDLVYQLYQLTPDEIALVTRASQTQPTEAATAETEND